MLQYNAHKTRRASVVPNVVCLCLHIKKGKDHFDTFNAHFNFAQFLIILHLSKKGRCRFSLQTDTHTMYKLLSSIGKYVDWACANALKHGTITVSGFGYFHKNCRFLWEKICFKDKFRKNNTLYLNVIWQIFPTLYGFRGVAAQWNRALPLVHVV